MELGKVSVFIPCRNEVNHIAECVDAIMASNYHPVEVTVVDGMSDDGTRDVLDDLANKYPNFKYVDNPNQLTPYAFNLGVKNSSGEFIQIVGSRNVLDPDYIPLLVQTLIEKPDVICVGGDYQHSYLNDESQWISLAMESKFGVGGSNYRVKRESCYVDTVGVPMYRAKVFEEIGLFDEELTRNQDDDFNYRVTQAGHKIYYNAEAKTKYYVRGSLKKAFKQFFQYGYFKVFVNKKHKAVTTVRQLVPFFFVSYLMTCFTLMVFWPWFQIPFFGVLLIYFFVGHAAAGEFTKVFAEKLKIQRAMFVLHLGYGFGYLRGVIDFLILGRKPAGSLQQQTT